MFAFLCYSAVLLLVTRADDPVATGDAPVTTGDEPVTLTPPVATSYGPVRGAVRSYDGRTVHVFKGIPFAAPPVAGLRFSPPVAPVTWQEPLTCVEYRNRCVANKMMDEFFYPPPRVRPPMDEDCLHLSVAAPQPANEKRAVMVFIHGGALTMGSSTDIEIEGLAIGGDVIHVAINYRLNVFGFLATSDVTAPGNVGFLDQVLALKWVKENIGNFGGDPERITIFGESAGGWSVSAHMVSPLSRGLFSRAIAQSGSMYGFNLDSQEERNKRTEQLGEAMSCPGEDILNCLREKPAQELLEASENENNLYLPFMAPVYGDSFLPEPLTDLYNKHQTHPGVEYITGITSEEGGGWLMMYNETEQRRIVQEGVDVDDVFITTIKDQVLYYILALEGKKVGTMDSLIQNFYFKDKTDKISNVRGILDLASDVIFTAPAVGMAEKVVEGGNNKMWLYYFAQTPATPAPSVWPHIQLYAAPELNFGALHGFDLFYTFGVANLKEVPMSWEEEAPEEDKQVAGAMLEAWASFAKSGSPVYLASNDVRVEWPEYNVSTEEYLMFKHPMSSESVKRRLKPGVSEMWNKLIPAYMETVVDKSEEGGDSEGTKDEL